jgi:hypothetical protein
MMSQDQGQILAALLDVCCVMPFGGVTPRSPVRPERGAGCPGPLILSCLGLDNPWANAEVDKYFLLKERSIFFLTKWKETPLNQKLLRCRGVRT